MIHLIIDFNAYARSPDLYEPEINKHALQAAHENKELKVTFVTLSGEHLNLKPGEIFVCPAQITIGVPNV